MRFGSCRSNDGSTLNGLPANFSLFQKRENQLFRMENRQFTEEHHFPFDNQHGSMLKQDQNSQQVTQLSKSMHGSLPKINLRLL